MAGKETPLRVGTLFSGIGAFEQALKQMNVPHEIAFVCDNGERYLTESEEYLKAVTAKMTPSDVELFINAKYEATGKPNLIKKTYFANYGDKLSEDRWFNDIRFMDGKQFKDKIDILVGGSPCQLVDTLFGMRKARVIENCRCYHLISRLAHRAFFLNDEEKTRAVELRGDR